METELLQQKTKIYAKEIHYPDSDGQPMADNTLQFSWLVMIKDNLELLFRNQPQVFVAGDLLWYPVEGQPKIRYAPDVLVAFGRPKGYRGSYLQWVEEHVPVQVVFEILSPGNRKQEMEKKFSFYEQYGVEEYYVYDPHKNRLQGWHREQGRLNAITQLNGWLSPRLGVRFELGDELRLYHPNGEQFRSYIETIEQKERDQVLAEVYVTLAEARAEQEYERAEQEQHDKELALQRAEQERHDKELAQKHAEQEWQRAEQERHNKELAQKQAEQEWQRAEQERRDKELAQKRAEQERRDKELAQQQMAQLAAKLRELGLEPESILNNQ